MTMYIPPRPSSLKSDAERKVLALLLDPQGHGIKSCRELLVVVYWVVSILHPDTDAFQAHFRYWLEQNQLADAAFTPSRLVTEVYGVQLFGQKLLEIIDMRRGPDRLLHAALYDRMLPSARAYRGRPQPQLDPELLERAQHVLN